MDEDLFQSIVDQISYHPVQLIQPFLNNDPLMDKNILPRLELIIKKNPRARVSVTTNGYLLREEIARALARLPLDTIHISSNGLTPEVYRETMGLDGYTVIRNVNYLWDQLRKYQSPTKLVVTAILLQSNQREVVHMRDYWHSRGVTFYLNPLNNRAGNLTHEKFVQLLPFNESVRRGQLLSYNMSGCPALYSFMGILWNGDLITCCMDWRRSRVLGNARDDSLSNLWQGKPYQDIRELSNTGRLAELSLCRQCGDNKFSIDLETLRELVECQDRDADQERDRETVATLERIRREQPGTFQLALLRESR
jgi:MoaA/NifB/PqqE/SkfB family radical SAM enzyme